MPQSDSEVDFPSQCHPPFDLLPCERDEPAPPAQPAMSALLGNPFGGLWSTPCLPSVAPYTPAVTPCTGATNIPLHLAPNPHSLAIPDITTAIRIVMVCINICMLMITMYTTSTGAKEGHLAHRNKSRRRKNEDDVYISLHSQLEHEHKDNALQHPHVKQVFDLLVWHIGIVDAKWYIRPRSTCWFEEYIFNIYTPDMFYDILCEGELSTC